MWIIIIVRIIMMMLIVMYGTDAWKCTMASVNNLTVEIKYLTWDNFGKNWLMLLLRSYVSDTMLIIIVKIRILWIIIIKILEKDCFLWLKMDSEVNLNHNKYT